MYILCYITHSQKEVINNGQKKIISENPTVTDIVKSAISSEIRKLEIGLNRTNRKIKQFEEQYKINSDTFLKELSAEDLKGKDEEYIEWLGEIKIRERILEELSNIRDIEYVDN